MIRAKTKEDCVVGVDLGGTKILAAVVDPAGGVRGEAKELTLPAADATEIVGRMVHTVHRAVERADLPFEEIVAVGVGAPAPVDPRTGILNHAANLPLLSHFPLGDRLREALDRPVFVDNDVNVGTVGEHALGAGRGTRDMVGIFVGTGIGGGIILDGRLRHGFRNSAGEIGHLAIGYQNRADEPRCGCGRPGCAEAYASRTAIEHRIRAALAAGRESIIPALLAKKGKERITSGILAKALERGDPLVIEVMESCTTYLSLLVAGIVNLLDPERIVIGGGVAEALGERLLEPIRRDAPRSYLKPDDAGEVGIVLAELGDRAGVLGAATIAREQLDGG
jgi:glucokinase